MTPHDEIRTADALGDYWNTFTADPAGDGAVPAELDGSLAATVRRIDDLRRPDTPDAAFAAALWEDLMDGYASSPPVALDTTGALTALPRTLAGRPRSLEGRGRTWVHTLEFAAALLLIVSLFGLIASRSSEVTSRVGSLVGQDDEGEEEPTGTSFGAGGSIELTAEEAAALPVAIDRVTLAPGATWTTAEASKLVLVLDGIVIAADPGSATGGQTQRAGFGTSGEGAFTYRNDSAAPATLLLASINSQSPPAASAGVAIEPVTSATLTLPPGPSLLFLEQRFWPAGDQADVEAGAQGAAIVAASAGEIRIDGAAGEVELRVANLADQAPAAGQYADGVALRPGDSAVLQGGVTASVRGVAEESSGVVFTINPDALDQMGGRSIAEAAFGSPAPPPPGGTPVGAAAAVDPGACSVTPRNAAELAALATLPTPDPTDNPDGGPDGRNGLLEQDLPAGDPVDAATLAAITEVERQFAACYNAGDLPRLLTVMSDEIATLLLADVGDSGLTLAATPTPLNPDEFIALFPLRDARLLPDGRVGAIVDWATGSEPTRRSESNFHIYVWLDGAWLLDEEISIIN